MAVRAKLQAENVHVLRVEDGDSITVKVDQTKYRIRLAEIDAPELDQTWGAESKAASQKNFKTRKFT